MKKLYIAVLLCWPAVFLGAQDIAYIKGEQITRWKAAAGDTVYVLNFWATWCAPCVAELPAFERLHREYAQRPVKIILVSTDFRRDVEKKVKPFVKRKKLQNQVVFMDEATPNNWVDLVSPEWTGAIPATLVVNKARGVELLFEKQVGYEELEKAVLKGLE